jgi:hypothetical protein
VLNATFGSPYNVTARDGTAGLTVTRPVTDASLDQGFMKPENGQFVSFTVSFTGKSGGFDYNPFDFYVRTSTGAHIEHTFGKEPGLHSGTLHPGEPVSGYITFDEPAHGTLVYQPSAFESSLAEWQY